MRPFRDISIKQKLTLITMLTSSVALLMACIAFVTYEQVTFRRSMVRDYAILADMFDDNVAPGLAFNDPSAIESVLQTLSANVHVLAAVVYDSQGELAAQYERADMSGKLRLPLARPTGSSFADDRLEIFQAITLAGEEIGTVCIVCDLEELNTRLERYAAIAGLVLLASLFTAFLLSTKLRRIISEPISQLGTVSRAVAAERNYSLRAVKRNEDELGRLTDDFNDMLAQIQVRDGELHKARDELEKRVEERTSELKSEMAERTRVAAELETSKNYVDSIIKSMVNTLIVVQPDTTISFANRSALQLLGYTEDELIGRPLADVMEEHRPGAVSPIDELANHDVITDVEISYRTKEGVLVPMTLSASALRTGALTGYVCVAQDISLRKKAERELEEVHKQLWHTSRQAGMAEVATSVLHNVGNVLNSVNVSATLVADQVRQSKAANVAKVSALLHQHEADLVAFLTSDARGRQIPGYLRTLADHLAAEHNNVLKELESLVKNIEHIKDIVMMQQSYAKISGVTETLPVADLVEDAVRMNAGALVRHDVSLSRDYQAKPNITVEKHKVLQILVNLLRNAKYACDESGRTDKKIVIRISEEKETVKIAVIDNGIGIPPENITRIFAHGFTTRKEGHGFGLHSGALAAKEIGGSLNAYSEGPGRGASFVLELPLQTKGAAS